MKPEIYKDEGYRFMGEAFEVYNERGHGLGEEIYQECMETELELRAIPVRPKQELACFYKGRELKKRYIGYLVNFGHKDTLEWKRVILSEFIPTKVISVD